VRSAAPGASGERPIRYERVVLEGQRVAAARLRTPAFLVDVLDVVPRGLGGDAEIVGELLVDCAHEHEKDFQLSVG